MPIYVYRCRVCGEQFDKLVSIGAASQPQTCPQCGAFDAQKQIAAPSAVPSAKGGGCSSPAGGGFT
ncbi:MAG: zinc ribbon domain-containing protein [Deltaproteobacteria bacterium]|nr:zinc ribbon domain-containing protein [Deltaproteobacteria bacterium]